MAHEYEHTQIIQAPPEEVFRFVSDVENLPKYLPTTHSAQPQGEDRVRVQGEVRGQEYDADGFFHRDEQNRRLEWGSDGEMQYRGWLEVSPDGGPDTSRVTVHLSMTPPPQMQQGMNQSGTNMDQKVQEGLEKALQSIQNYCEGKSGKEEPRSAHQG